MGRDPKACQRCPSRAGARPGDCQPGQGFQGSLRGTLPTGSLLLLFSHVCGTSSLCAVLVCYYDVECQSHPPLPAQAMAASELLDPAMCVPGAGKWLLPWVALKEADREAVKALLQRLSGGKHTAVIEELLDFMTQGYQDHESARSAQVTSTNTGSAVVFFDWLLVASALVARGVVCRSGSLWMGSQSSRRQSSGRTSRGGTACSRSTRTSHPWRSACSACAQPLAGAKGTAPCPGTPIATYVIVWD